MNKVVSLTLGIFLLGSGLVFAQQSSVPQSSMQPADAGNTFCPVSGRPIGVMGPGAKVQYNGKTYHLCCGGCISTFNNNPEKYSKIAETPSAQSTTNGQ